MDGKICQCGPGTMIGYDDPAATARTIKIHADDAVGFIPVISGI